MNILKISEIPNVSNAAIAEELSDEDIKVEWVERPKGVSDRRNDYFKITMFYRGEVFSFRIESGNWKYKNMTQIIKAYKNVLKVDANIRETFGEKGMDILEQGHRTGQSAQSPKIYYKLSKPKWAKDIPHTTDERYVEIHLELYRGVEIYVGIEGKNQIHLTNVDNLDSSLAGFYKDIREELHEKFLRKSWKNIIKISETERDIARGSDVWAKEVKNLKRNAEEEWKEKITWHGTSAYTSGFLGNKKLKVIAIDKDTLSITKDFPEVSNDIVESIYNSFISYEDYIRIQEGIIYINIFEDRWGAEALIKVLGAQPDKLDKLENFLNDLKVWGDYLTKVEFRFKPFNELERILVYRIKKQMSAQSSDWKYFSSFKEIEKEIEEAFAPDIRAETLVEGIINDNPNINKVSYEDMLKVLDKIHGEGRKENVWDYLKIGDKNAWVQVVTDMDNVYYVNTKTAASRGYTCRLMMFNRRTRFCVETYNEKLPYGDQVAALLLSLSNESKVREQGQWGRFSQEI